MGSALAQCPELLQGSHTRGSCLWGTWVTNLSPLVPACPSCAGLLDTQPGQCPSGSPEDLHHPSSEQLCSFSLSRCCRDCSLNRSSEFQDTTKWVFLAKILHPRSFKHPQSHYMDLKTLGERFCVFPTCCVHQQGETIQCTSIQCCGVGDF